MTIHVYGKYLINTINLRNAVYRSSFSIILFCLLWLCHIKPAYCFSTPPKNFNAIISKLEEHIQNLVNKKRIPGCAIAIVHNNEVILMNGYGVRTLGRKEKVDVDTVFQLGSVSKPVAATLASVLENKGVIHFEDPVNHYLPHFSLNSVQPASAVKIKHILSHSTGVSRAGFNDLIEAHAPFHQILNKLKNTRVRRPVGRQYDYHNAMFSVISEVTRSATRQSFPDALRNNLLQPLNMTRTSATYEALLSTENRASPHTRCGKGLVPCGTYSHGYYNVAPAGGVNSSVRDMATFLKAQMGGYPQVVSPQALERIHTPQVTTKGMLQTQGRHLIKNHRYALGWRVADFANHKIIFHGGWLKGFTNFVAFVPDQSVGIVILHNGEKTKFSSATALKFFELWFDIPQKKPRKELIGSVIPKSKSKVAKSTAAKKNRATYKRKATLKNKTSKTKARLPKKITQLKYNKNLVKLKKIAKAL